MRGPEGGRYRAYPNGAQVVVVIVVEEEVDEEEEAKPEEEELIEYGDESSGALLPVEKKRHRSSASIFQLSCSLMLMHCAALSPLLFYASTTFQSARHRGESVRRLLFLRSITPAMRSFFSANFARRNFSKSRLLRSVYIYVHTFAAAY